jgi:hypothetical protein
MVKKTPQAPICAPIGPLQGPTHCFPDQGLHFSFSQELSPVSVQLRSTKALSGAGEGGEQPFMCREWDLVHEYSRFFTSCGMIPQPILGLGA